MCQLPKIQDDKLIVGLETSDDAAVYQVKEDLALVQTLDFFTPVVDDPYTFGQIAATNSLSDVYAMGADPKLAMNIVCFPDCLDPQILSEILKGGQSKVEEAGALVIGGHSIEDDEPKYGLSVTGLINPKEVLTNSNAQVGDILVLTKPLGMGIINTAIKGQLVDEKTYDQAVKIMTSLNKYAKEAIDRVGGVNALTDITGFGLLGHVLEMAEGSDKTIRIDSDKVPIVEAAVKYARMGLVPGGTYSNKSHLESKIKLEGDLADEIVDILYDPQTAGGLLISIKPEKIDELLEDLKGLDTDFGVIGEVVEKENYHLIVE